MKLACASTAFDRMLQSGDLTQIEFIEACAREMAFDGVVLDARHFPRTDADYLAQIKKMATDLGLCMAALRDDGFFGSDEAAMRGAIDCALALGAPLVASQLVAETSTSWSDQLEQLGTAATLAKAANVTVALRNVPQTFAATTHDLKRAAKETDSAWLRFALDPAALDVASDPAAIVSKVVLVWMPAQIDGERIRELLVPLADFRGFVAVDDASGNASVAEMNSALSKFHSDRT